MNQNLEVVKKLKNGDSERTNYFKNEIRKYLEALKVDFDEEMVDDYLKQAIDTCTEEVKLPFLFHLKAVIKRSIKEKEEIDTGIFTSFEYKVLSLYFNMQDGKYLSKMEIAEMLHYGVNTVSDVISTAFKKDKNEVERIFPGYRNISKKRDKYFEEKNNTMSVYQLELIKEFCGAVEKPLSINQLSTKYKKAPDIIKEDLIRAFNKLQKGNNLKKLLEEFPNLENNLQKRKEKLKFKLTKGKSYERKEPVSKLAYEELKCLKFLWRFKDKAVTKDDINIEGYADVFHYIDARIKIFKKLTRNNELVKIAKKFIPDFDYEVLKNRGYLTKKEIRLLILLNKYHDSTDINADKLAKLGNYGSKKAFLVFKSNLFSKLRKNPILLEEALSYYKNLDVSKREIEIKEQNNEKLLTDKEIKLLMLLEETKGDPLSNEEMASRLDYKSKRGYSIRKTALFNKILSDKEILEEALKYCSDPSTLLLPVKSKNNTSIKKRELKDFIHRHKQLVSRIIATNEGYEDYKSADEKELFTVISADTNLYEQVMELKSKISYDIKECEMLSNLEIKFLKLLNRHKNSPLTSEEMREKLNVDSLLDYLVLRYTLFQKIKTNENLKREALSIFPDLSNYIDLEKASIKITFSNNEINYLQEICLVKDNHLVYQTRREISSKLSISYDDARKYERNSLTKIINSVDEDNDLNITLWPNFLEEFMIRDNFRKTDSVKINEKDLENIKEKDSKGKILKGIKALEQSVFKNYVSTCSDLEKKILALRLGYFDCKFFSSEEVANIMNVPIETVINLTKSCLECSKDEYFRDKKVLCKGREAQNV